MEDRHERPSGDAVIELSGIVSLINGFPALAGIDLTVTEGEILLIRGHNGAGKSTLLRLCAGLATVAEGSATVLGNDLAKADERRTVRRATGLLAHESFLYDELTVEENLAFWTEANRVEVAAVEPLLDRLGLNGRLREVKVSGLSAGQRRRASLAVVVSRRPKLWLLDEPHTGLDPAGRDLVDQLVRQAVNFGATVVISSHDVERVSQVATRAVTLIGGQAANQRRPMNSRAPSGSSAVGSSSSIGEGQRSVS